MGRKLTCFIPGNRTVGVCVCRPAWNVTRIIKTRMNCTDDSECRWLKCPMILSSDTPVCVNNRCTCGARWQLKNATEWKERFKQELTNKTLKIREMIRQKVEAEVGRRLAAHASISSR